MQSFSNSAFWLETCILIFTLSIKTFIFYASEFQSVTQNKLLKTPDLARKDQIALLFKLHYFEASA